MTEDRVGLLILYSIFGHTMSTIKHLALQLGKPLSCMHGEGLVPKCNKIILLRSIMAYFWSIMAYLWSIIGINCERQSIA